MSSNEDPDSTSSGGFIKSVIKALSGTRAKTPNDSGASSPSEQNSEGLEDQEALIVESSEIKKSSEKRGYEDENHSPPIRGAENVVDNQVKKSSRPMLRSPDQDFAVRQRVLGRGLSANFESDLQGAPPTQPSQTFSSFLIMVTIHPI